MLNAEDKNYDYIFTHLFSLGLLSCFNLFFNPFLQLLTHFAGLQSSTGPQVCVQHAAVFGHAPQKQNHSLWYEAGKRVVEATGQIRNQGLFIGIFYEKVVAYICQERKLFLCLPIGEFILIFIIPYFLLSSNLLVIDFGISRYEQVRKLCLCIGRSIFIVMTFYFLLSSTYDRWLTSGHLVTSINASTLTFNLGFIARRKSFSAPSTQCPLTCGATVASWPNYSLVRSGVLIYKSVTDRLVTRRQPGETSNFDHLPLF